MARTIVVLTDDEKYHVYKYMVENRCVVQNDEGMWKFRMHQKEILKEINALNFLGRNIKEYHIRNSMEVVTGWQYRLSKVPQLKETMEIEQLREQHIRDINEIEKLKLQMKELSENLIKVNSQLKEKTTDSFELAAANTKLGKIKSILGA